MYIYIFIMLYNVIYVYIMLIFSLGYIYDIFMMFGFPRIGFCWLMVRPLRCGA